MLFLSKEASQDHVKIDVARMPGFWKCHRPEQVHAIQIVAECSVEAVKKSLAQVLDKFWWVHVNSSCFEQNKFPG